MNDWIDRKAALELLGVKAQTLYAYASRGRVSTQPDPCDPQRSLYRYEDVAALASKRARSRSTAAIAKNSMAWGEPSIPTLLSTAHHGKLYYRGQDAVELARTATLEDIAALLWSVSQPVSFSSADCGVCNPFVALATMIAASASTLQRDRTRLCCDAADVVGLLASASGCAPSDDPVHTRLARVWGLSDTDAERVRQALVVMADHDLNASTFATRVAASTGASIAASVLAGLCALSGPRHGGASAAIMSLLEQAERDGPAVALTHWLDHGAALPGFGHPLYPGGDPRATLMLKDVTLDPLMTQLCEFVGKTTGELPNCDFAMAALVRCCGFPANAPFVMFMIGRSVGWCAHAIEQISDGVLIRPRGRYTGVLPQ
jgi:citrate synthase